MNYSIFFRQSDFNFKIFKTILFIFFINILLSSIVYSQEACGIMPAPNADDIHCLGINIDDALYIGTWGDGLYKTTNDATTVNKMNGIRGNFIAAICFSKIGTIYVATADSGVYKSTNAGNTWSEITNGVPLFGKSITCVTGTNATSDKIYYGTFGQGIYVSTNGGTSWQQSNDGLFNLDISALTVNSDNKVIAGVYGASNAGGLYDNLITGDTAWTKRSNGIGGSKFINSFGKDKSGNLFVAINGNTAWTTDVTNVWSPICSDNSTITDNNFTCISYANPKPLGSKYDETIGTRSKGIWYYDNRVYQNWQQSPSGIKTGGVNGLVRRSNGTLYAAMAGRGLVMSTDNGMNWNGIGPFDFRNSSSQITAGYAGIVYVTPRPGGLFRSIDYGLSWSGNLYTRTIISDFPKIKLIKAYNSKIYLADNDTVNTGLRISADSGKTWSFAPTAPNKFIISIAICPTNPQILYCVALLPLEKDSASKIQIYKSINGGSTLTAVSSFILGDFNSKITCVNDSTVYCFEGSYRTGTRGNYVISNRVFYSTNGGLAWNPTTPFNVNNISIRIQDFQVDSTNNVYAAASDGLYFLAAGTSNFTQINTLNKKLSVDDVAFVNRIAIKSNNEIYVGLDGDVGVYYTSNAGANWSNINSSYNTTSLRDMTVGTEGDVYFVASAAYRIVNPSKMEKPVMILPKCESKGLLLKPTFSWNKSVRADMYELFVCTEFDTTDGGAIIHVLQSPTTYTAYHNLLPNTTYLWRVRGKANGSYSEWSDFCSFTTQAGPPKLIYPANLPDTLSKGIPVLCQFNWFKADNVDRYHIQVSKDSLFKTLVFEKDSIADSTYLNKVNQKMPPLTKLWWRAMCWNSKYANVSNWSKPNQFLTTLAPPNRRNPTNNSPNESSTILFVWDSVNTATQYELQVTKDTTFTNPAVDLIFQYDELSHLVTALEYNINYCWRMRSFNPDGVSEWTDPWCFTTSLQGPSNAIPATEATCLDTLVGFSWSKVPKATAYIIQIASDNQLKNLLVNDTITLNSFTKSFKLYTSYYWRVCALVDQTQGKWIQTRIFKTGLEKTITKAPNNLEKLISFPVELHWNDVNNAIAYTVRLAKDKAMKNILIEKSNITVNSYTITGLDTCSNYYWSVSATTPDCNGPWSDTISFKTMCPSGGDVNDYIAQEYNVKIYPNPFTSTVNINFITKQTSWTTVSIYNSAGSKVITLIDKEINLGEHNVDWTPNGIAKGIYYLNIKTKDYDIMREINFK